MRYLLFISVLLMVPSAVLGYVVAGMGGAKLALGIMAMFASTTAIIIYALNDIEKTLQ